MGTPEIHIIRKDDSAYPALLRQIADPPEQLYCRGNEALLNSFCIGIVGTRKASEYGRQACTDIASYIAARTITVVSGLAMGIDAIAHQAALNSQGTTIAVLGSGVDDASIGPRENFNLAMDIIAHGGLVVSEYKPGTQGAPWTFPTRNRIISGLSRGVVVIEADKKSGSLITAKSALEQDRDVFAVPGSIYWPRSVGSNWLIQEGARPVIHGEDIIRAYQLEQHELPNLPQTVSTQDPVQQKILAILKDNGPTHLDTLTTQSGYQVQQVSVAVAMLELHDYIRHQGSGIYICN